MDASSDDELCQAVLAIDRDGKRVELTLREWARSAGWTPSQAQAQARASASASPSRCSSPRWP